MKQGFAERHLVIVDIEDANIEIIHPQRAILAVNNKVNNGKRYLDCGSLCYTRREKIANPRVVGDAVDLDSLDNNRIPVVQKLVNIMRMKASATALSLFSNVRHFFDWIDNQEDRYEFNKEARMRAAYFTYTQHLLHRLNASGIRGQPIKQGTASAYQSGARMVVLLATGLSEPQVNGIATTIHQKNNASHLNLKLPNSDQQARTFATLINFINEAHRILVDGGEFPMRLASPDGDSYYLYTLYQETDKAKAAGFSLNPMLKWCPSFPSWHDVKEHFQLPNNSKETNVQRTAYDQAKIRFRKNNKDCKSDLKRKISSHAITASMLAFVAATGCNLSIAQNLEADTLENVPSTQGNRLSGTKARADGKTVYPEFGARFAPIFTKILALRQWVLDDRDTDLVFAIFSVKSDYITKAGAQSVNHLKKIIGNALPRTTWVTPTQWRKNVSYQYVKHSGDLTLTAEKLGNAESTLRKNYARPALEDFAGEMTAFFETMHKAAIDRTRSVELIPVNIKEDRRPETLTGIGACEKGPTRGPQRAHGFTEQAPLPSCGDPETCLFCEFYAVHADEDDIRRLLSLRYLIQAIKGQQPHDHWEAKFGPIIHRIDEVLSAIKQTNCTIEETISRICDEVESGALDPFWAIHFDTLVYIGAIF